MKTALKPGVLMAITLCGSAAADTIYSNLLDSPIPANFTGTFMTIDGGTVNPFFGGVGVANNNLFQPVRDGSGNLDTIQNLAVGELVDAGRLFSTGYGGSQDHLGSTFTAGQEGVIGFKTGNGNYGWMRVVFTGNTSGAVIKDWAYDNSGSAIVVGRVQQSSPSGGAQTMTLSPGIGESFTLGSQITNTGGNTNSVVKTGGGSTTIIGINSYTGSTSVNEGRLVVNGDISSSLLTTVNSGGTLDGTGTTGSVHVTDGGMFTAGNGLGILTVDGNLQLEEGSTTEFQIATGGQSDLAIITAQASFGGTLHLINTGGDLVEGDAFHLFDWNTRTGTFSSVVLPTLTSGLAWNQENLYTTGTLMVVPEPGPALLGGIGVLLLLRRRRTSDERFIARGPAEVSGVHAMTGGAAGRSCGTSGFSDRSTSMPRKRSKPGVLTFSGSFLMIYRNMEQLAARRRIQFVMDFHVAEIHAGIVNYAREADWVEWHVIKTLFDKWSGAGFPRIAHGERSARDSSSAFVSPLLVLSGTV